MEKCERVVDVPRALSRLGFVVYQGQEVFHELMGYRLVFRLQCGFGMWEVCFFYAGDISRLTDEIYSKCERFANRLSRLERERRVLNSTIERI